METAHRTVFEKHPKKTLSVIIFILVIVLDFGVAAVLKAIGLFQPSYISSNVASLTTKINEASYRQKNKVYHHTLKPYIDFDKAEWGGKPYRVRTNSLGFKDRMIRDIPLRIDKDRIVLIGDSFTEGIGVEFSETFAGIIQSNLSAHNIDVLNAGVASYSPIIYFRKMKYLIENVGLKFERLVVLIDISDIVDEAEYYVFDSNNNVVSKEVSITPVINKDSFKEFITQNTLILGRLRNLSAWFRLKLRSWDRALNNRRSMWTIDEKLYSIYGKKGLTNAAEHMDQLKVLLDKHKISLTVVVYPWPDQIYYGSLNSKQVTFWRQWSAENQIEFINLFPAFLRFSSKPETTIKKLYIRHDAHWNEAGHQFVADMLLESFSFASKL